MQNTSHEIPAPSPGAKSGPTVKEWIKGVLWSRWGWEGWTDDDFHQPYRDEVEKARIQSAVEFVLRCLANPSCDGSEYVLAQIEQARAAKSGANHA